MKTTISRNYLYFEINQNIAIKSIQFKEKLKAIFKCNKQED